MADIFIPLQGPGGIRPKAPAVGAWQSPGYRGVPYQEYTSPPYKWLGLRCDGLVVIDCDNQDAANAWAYLSGGGMTWTRKTPHGWHYIYRNPGDVHTGPKAGLWPGIDIREGRTSQIVYYAPGYFDHIGRTHIADFRAEWLATAKGLDSESDRSSEGEEWDEMPDGRGNNTMAAIAGAMRKQGMSGQTIAKCLGAINKITMTKDPMPRQMIAQIVMSICRYKPKPDIDIEIEE